MDLEEIQEQIDTAPEEAKLMEDKLMEMSVSNPESGRRQKNNAGKQIGLDNLAKGFWLFHTPFDCFYDMDPSMTGTLKLNQTVKIGSTQKQC